MKRAWMRAGSIVLAWVVVGSATPASAGVEETKAIRASEALIAETTAATQRACGNARLESKIDWSRWHRYDYAKLRTSKVEVLRYTGALAKSVLDSMAELCKDPDYKAEIAKVSTVRFSGKKDPAEQYVAFKLAGTSLQVQLNGDGVGSWKNAELLKAVWE